MPSGFQSLIPLSGAGLCEAVIIAPHAYSAAPRASVGVETSPASTTSDPVDKTPAMSARAGVTSTFPRPRMPDDPNRVNGDDTACTIDSPSDEPIRIRKEVIK